MPEHNDIDKALDVARELIRHGIPVFVAKRASTPTGETDWNGEHVSEKDRNRFLAGYLLPRWTRVGADERELDRYEPGDALGMVCGHGIDVIDVDRYSGGSESVDELRAMGALPESYGEAETVSGGTHLLIRSLGIASSAGVPKGVDLRSGTSTGTGRGFVWIAPTVRLGKDRDGVADENRGKVRRYRWTQRPDLDRWADNEDDDSGTSFALLIESRRNNDADLESEDHSGGRAFSEFDDYDKARIVDYVNAKIDGMIDELTECHDWPEGYRPNGKGWDALCASVFWRFWRVAHAAWSPPFDVEKLRNRLFAAAPSLPRAELKAKWADKRRRTVNLPAPLPFSLDDGTTLTTADGTPIVDPRHVDHAARRAEAFGWQDVELPDVRRVLGLQLPGDTEPVRAAIGVYRNVFADASGNPNLVRWNGDWYVRQRARWTLVPDGDMSAALQRILLCATKLAPDGNGGFAVRPWKVTPAALNNVSTSLGHHANLTSKLTPPCYIPGPPSNLPEPNRIIVFNDGVVDAATGEFIPGVPDRLFNLAHIDADFGSLDAVGNPTRWLTFLHSIFGDDADTVELLRQWIYYVLTGDRSQQKAMLMLGPPRSGKGTIVRIMLRLLGLPASDWTAPTLANLSETFGVEQLIGAPLAVFTDVRADRGGVDRAAIERLLAIIGNDPQTIQRKHRTAFKGELPTRFMLLSNELPRFIDPSGAMASRFIVVQTKVSFLGNEDTELESKLTEELPAILKWVLGAREKFVADKEFIKNRDTRVIQDDLKLDGSTVRMFLAERCILGEELDVSKAEFRNSYVEWCRDNGYSAISTRQVNTELRAMASEIPGLKGTSRDDQHKVKFGVRRVEAYKGFRLRTAADDADDDAKRTTEPDTDSGHGTDRIDPPAGLFG